MFLSKQQDKHGTLQLHDELAILMDLLTSAYKVTEQHIDTTTNEARNYTQVHVVQAGTTPHHTHKEMTWW